MDERLKSWIVKILPSEDAEIAQGTGFWAAEDGYVLTCTHVVEGMNLPWVEYKEQKAHAKIVAQKGDITLLKVQGLSGEPAPLGTKYQREDKVDSLGYQYEGTASRIGYFPMEGIISGGAELDNTERITLKEASHVKHGASGAPALNRDTGKVIGIISDKWDKQDVAFVLPLGEVLKQWDVLKKAVKKIEMEPLIKAICQYLKTIENDFKYISIFRPPYKMIMQDLYIPIEVTLERRYRHKVETSWGYVEGEMEISRAYAMKGMAGKENLRTQIPWKEAKQKHKRLIVLADPGMGKTGLLKMEAVTTAHQQRQNLIQQTSFWGIEEIILPLFLRLPDLADKDEEVIYAIPKLLQHNYPNVSSAVLPLLEEKLKNGTCLLLLDALDEVPQEQRNLLSEKLTRFARHCPCPIICSSRIVGYSDGFLDDAKEVEIVPFNRKQTEEYIESWFEYVEENSEAPRGVQSSVNLPNAKGLIRELREKPQIQGLTQNPLLLSLLCNLYQENELTLPTRRVQIYEQAVHYMLYEWRRISKRRLTAQALTDDAWIAAKLGLFEQLAYQFSCEHKEIFSMREFSAKIKICKRNTDFEDIKTPDIINELSKEDGIIQRLDGQGHNTRYIFLHRTFQEYLTASYLKHQPNGIELVKAHLWDFDWHETIAVLAGLLGTPIPLLATVINEKDDIFSTLLLLAGKCIAECNKQTPPLVQHIIDKLFTFWRTYSGLDFIGTTVANIIQSNERFLEDFKRNIYDETGLLSLGAINVLGRVASIKTTDILVETFNYEYDTHNKIRTFIQKHIAKTLQKIALSKATEALDQKAEALIPYIHHKDMKIREEAIWFLGDIGTSKSLEIVGSVLQSECERIQTTALTVLGEVASKKAIQILTEAIDQKDEYVSRMAISRLGKIGNEKAIQSLAKIIYHPNSDIRMLAVSALSETSNIEAVEVLAKTLDHYDENIRVTSINSLGRIGSRDAIRALIQGFDHSDKMVKMRAVSILRLLNSQEAKKALSLAYKHHDSLVRLMATINPEEIEDQDLAQSLKSSNELSKQTLSRQDMKIQQLVSAALENYSEAEAAEIFAQFFADGNSDIRWNAIGALQQLCHSRTIEVLKSAFNDPDKLIRVKAVIALKEIVLQKKESVSQQAKKVLQQALIHQDSNVRVMAADALGKVGDSETLRILIEHPKINIWDTGNFFLARTLAIQLSQEKSSTDSIPVYPELFTNKPLELQRDPGLQSSKS